MGGGLDNKSIQQIYKCPFNVHFCYIYSLSFLSNCLFVLVARRREGGGCHTLAISFSDCWSKEKRAPVARAQCFLLLGLTASVAYSTNDLQHQWLTASVAYSISDLQHQWRTASVAYSISDLQHQWLTASVAYSISDLQHQWRTASVAYSTNDLQHQWLTASVAYSTNDLQHQWLTASVTYSISDVQHQWLTNSGSKRRFPHIMTEAMNEAGLANTRVPHEHNFEDSLWCWHLHRWRRRQRARQSVMVLGRRHVTR